MKILLALLIGFILLQFIRPARNVSGQVLPTDITRGINVPDKVLVVLKNSCYDCHSNSTRYPWYVNVQPVAWMMASHIKDGKDNLNFSAFGTYSNRKQANKLRSIAKSIEEGSMPVWSYTLIHTGAKLSAANKQMIIEWASKTKKNMEAE